MAIRLALTPGEPAGIGPDLAVTLAQQGSPHEIIAFADPQLLQQRARQLGLPLTLREVSGQPAPLAPGQLAIQPVELKAPCHPGQLSANNASYVLETLQQATACCQHSDCAALITGPVHKGIINEAGIPFFRPYRIPCRADQY